MVELLPSFQHTLYRLVQYHFRLVEVPLDLSQLVRLCRVLELSQEWLQHWQRLGAVLRGIAERLAAFSFVVFQSSRNNGERSPLWVFPVTHSDTGEPGLPHMHMDEVVLVLYRLSLARLGSLDDCPRCESYEIPDAAALEVSEA